MACALLSLLLAACARSEDSSPDNDEAVDLTAESSTAESASAAQGLDGRSESGESNAEEGGGEDVQPSAQETQTAEAIAQSQKSIVICVGEAPDSLSPLVDRVPSAEAIHHAIYEPLYTQVGYTYRARGLERMPSLAGGDAYFRSVQVEEGERVVDRLGQVVSLLDGVEVVNSAGETATFDGTPLEMEQMVVEFVLRPMFWSDGEPVTADDSVYSFNLAREGGNADLSSALVHTADYVATGERWLQWTGLPGYRDQTYFTNVWLPLPRQQDSSAVLADLAGLDETYEAPLSSGPFVIDEWREDGSLVLLRNAHYYLADEGYPTVDRLVIRFGNGEDFLAGEQEEPCDVITNDTLGPGNYALLESAAAQDDWEILSVPGTVFENIAFGVNPVIEYAERRPDWFEDPRVRQAITMCVDRESMVEELTQGQGQVIHAYVAPDHPLYPPDIEEWPYDPTRANALLDEAGYLDFADDGRRQDVSSGVPMTITLGTNQESTLRLRISEMVVDNLAECGIPVDTYELPAGTWYAPGPQGRLFGRRFDLAAFAWLAKIDPDCGLYLSENVTGPEEFGFGGWQNINVTGWSNEAFDAACGTALAELPGGDNYEALQQEALRIFARELPAIPLITNARFAAVRPWVENVQLDSAQESLLWNVHEWDVPE
ncbi:MAG: ABC transporter substrate-binding protein [Candidatus Promineifilaceae bacterium]|nr:ABC transporter substrate-binding protein [Candidatus Promineifilaceae bacterium]